MTTLKLKFFTKSHQKIYKGLVLINKDSQPNWKTGEGGIEEYLHKKSKWPINRWSNLISNQGNAKEKHSNIPYISNWLAKV